MYAAHGFNVGHPDNLVHVDLYLARLRAVVDAHGCIFCDKTFPDRATLKWVPRRWKLRAVPLGRVRTRLWTGSPLRLMAAALGASPMLLQRSLPFPCLLAHTCAAGATGQTWSAVQFVHFVHPYRPPSPAVSVDRSHMRKKKHYKINPANKAYDGFYLVNYCPEDHPPKRSHGATGAVKSKGAPKRTAASSGEDPRCVSSLLMGCCRSSARLPCTQLLPCCSLFLCIAFLREDRRGIYCGELNCVVRQITWQCPC